MQLFALSYVTVQSSRESPKVAILVVSLWQFPQFQANGS